MGGDFAHLQRLVTLNGSLLWLGRLGQNMCLQDLGNGSLVQGFPPQRHKGHKGL